MIVAAFDFIKRNITQNKNNTIHGPIQSNACKTSICSMICLVSMVKNQVNHNRWIKLILDWFIANIFRFFVSMMPIHGTLFVTIEAAWERKEEPAKHLHDPYKIWIMTSCLRILSHMLFGFLFCSVSISECLFCCFCFCCCCCCCCVVVVFLFSKQRRRKIKYKTKRNTRKIKRFLFP